MPKKLPHLQFYPGDWLRDHVAGCSLAAQGLWLRMMILMHDCERYGYLSINGSPIPPGSIARKCGCTPEQYDALFAELAQHGVPGVAQDGTIFSRRMVRDAQKRADGSERVKQHRNGVVTPNDNDIDVLISELEKERCYSHVNVRDELGKMQVWCRRNKKLPTPKRFVAWLNRIEKPLNGAAVRAVKPAAKDMPDAMRSYLIETYGDRREEIQEWKTLDQVPRMLRDEWYLHRKTKP